MIFVLGLTACGGGGGGSTPPANSAPTASGVSITDDNGGNALVGNSLTGNYTYADVDNDTEGASTSRWLRNGAAIGGATSSSYTLVSSDGGQMITFEVTPIATAGTVNGTAVSSSAITVVNGAPTASGVSITDDNGGNTVVGDSLTGNYTYGDVDDDVEGVSTFRWLRNGLDINGAATLTYTLVAGDSGQSITFEVIPVAVTGTTTGNAVTSAPISIVNSAPTASNVGITDNNGGNTAVSDSLTGNYTYNDEEGDNEGASIFRWLRNGAAISGATGSVYTTVPADFNQTISFEVTPIAATGSITGSTVTSSGIIVNSVATPNSLSLRLTAQQVNSDGQDSTTITATVLDINQAVIESVQVNFSTDTGKLSTSVAFTDSNGEAVVEFSADASNPSNQIATVTASVTNVGTASIPIEIIGTTLAITIANTSLQVPVGATNVTETVTITARDAGGQPIYNAPVIFTIATTGTAIVTPSIASGATDVRGEIKLTLTASGSGTATFTAQGLGALASQDLLVSDLNLNNPFRITSPTVDPTAITSGGVFPTDRVAVTVEADPALGIANVLYTASIGTWLSSGSPTSTLAFGGTATDTLIAGIDDTGFATVVVSDAADPTVFDSLTVAMSPPPDQAAVISIQSDVNVLPLSIGSSVFTANIEATVRTDDASGNYPVFNVPVVFTLEGAPGGGEVLTKSFGVTDLNGVVRTQFTSGILPSAQDAVRITAAVVAAPTVNDTIIVAIGGIGGSVAIGISPFLEVDEANTAVYRLDMAVDVADSTGGSVAGSNVILSVWPASYRTGAWYDQDPDPDQEKCVVYYSGPPFANEDTDEDLILDQELNPAAPPVYLVNEDINLDGLLTPHNSTSGSVPPLVVTDAEGVGAYQLTYLKQYARWIDVRARGTATVQGTITTGELTFNLSILRADADSCNIPAIQSPFDMVVTGAPGTIATILGAGVDPATVWTLPVFEGNNNASWSATTGTMNLVPPVAPDTITRAQYLISATALPGTEYLDEITISSATACVLATCSDLFVRFRVRVIVQ